MANNNEFFRQFVTTTVATVSLIDKETKLQLYSGTLKDCNIDFKEDTKKIQGGQGNPVIYQWGTNRKITIKLDDAVLRLDWIAAKLGQQVQNGKADVFKEAKTYDVNEKSFTLDVAPKDPNELMMFDDETGEMIELTKGYTIEGNKVTLIDSNITKVYVYGYKVNVDATFIDIQSDKFGKTFETIITMPLVKIQNGEKVVTHMKQYIFPNGQISGDMKDDTKANSDGGKVETTINVSDPGNGQDMGKILVFESKQLNSAQSSNVLK